MDVLRALEESTWHSESEDIEEVRRKENWKFWLDANPKAFTGNCEISDDTFFRLTNNAHRVKKMAKILQALLDTTLDIQDQFETALRRTPKPVIVKQSKGITSLPDEVLVQIFACAVSSHGRRTLALEERSLWTTLDSSAIAVHELDTFLARNGSDSDLHIIVEASSRESKMRKFLAKCGPFASRWRSLTVIEPLPDANNYFAFSFKSNGVAYTLNLVGDNNPLCLDRLEELHIKNHRFSCEPSWIAPEVERGLNDEFSNLVGFVPSWITPNLRTLNFIDYIPFPGPAFASITSFTLSIRLFPETFERQIERLLQFLIATSSITKLSLCIRDVLRLNIAEYFQFRNAICPSITSLRLHFMDYRIGEAANRFVSAFTNAFSIPGLEKLYVFVEFRYVDIMDPGFDGEACVEILSNLSNAFLPSNYAGPHLTSISYKFTLGARRSNDVVGNIDVPRRTFMIPLDRVPNLSSVTLTTFTRVIFYRDGSLVPCHLRELHFRKCSEIDEKSLQETIESLKDSGAWDTVENVTVKDCKKLAYETALDVVGAERLRFLEP